MLALLFFITLNRFVLKQTIWPDVPAYDHFGYSLINGSNGYYVSIGVISDDTIYAFTSFTTFTYKTGSDKYTSESQLILRQPDFYYTNDFPINPQSFGANAIMSEKGDIAIIAAPLADILNTSIKSMIQNHVRNVDPSKDSKTMEGTLKYIKEVGSAYIYGNGLIWDSINKNKGFYPENDAIPQCRFGGEIAGTRNLD